MCLVRKAWSSLGHEVTGENPQATHKASLICGQGDESVADRIDPVSFHMRAQVNMSWDRWSMKRRKEDPELPS